MTDIEKAIHTEAVRQLKTRGEEFINSLKNKLGWLALDNNTESVKAYCALKDAPKLAREILDETFQKEFVDLHYPIDEFLVEKKQARDKAVEKIYNKLFARGYYGNTNAILSIIADIVEEAQNYDYSNQ